MSLYIRRNLRRCGKNLDVLWLFCPKNSARYWAEIDLYMACVESSICQAVWVSLLQRSGIVLWQKDNIVGGHSDRAEHLTAESMS